MDTNFIFIPASRQLSILDKQISNIDIKKEKFKEKCNAWYEAYNRMDSESINKIAEELAKNPVLKGPDSKIKADNRIIQNMTKLTNNKNEKLSKEQLHLCILYSLLYVKNVEKKHELKNSCFVVVFVFYILFRFGSLYVYL